MSSGVPCSPDVESTFKQVKLQHNLKYVIYKIADDNSKIEVESTNDNMDLTYEEFTEALPRDEPRYAVYDYHWEGSDGKRTKLLFVFWAPDTCGIKRKMIYAASKDVLKKIFTGVVEIQANDFDELSEATVQDKVKNTK